MASWGCPHENEGRCGKVADRPCDPGMKGCVLAGRYVFANAESKNTRLREKKMRENPSTGTAGEELLPKL